MELEVAVGVVDVLSDSFSIVRLLEHETGVRWPVGLPAWSCMAFLNQLSTSTSSSGSLYCRINGCWRRILYLGRLFTSLTRHLFTNDLKLDEKFSLSSFAVGASWNKIVLITSNSFLHFLYGYSPVANSTRVKPNEKVNEN